VPIRRAEITLRHHRVALRVLHRHRATLTPSRETLQHVQGRLLTRCSWFKGHPVADIHSFKGRPNEASDCFDGQR